MKLIKLIIYKRGETLINEERAIDVDTIISPIRFNSDTSKSYFTVRTKNPTGNPGDLVNYQVDEELADIAALSNDFVLLTVTSRDGRGLVVGGVALDEEEMLFNVQKVAEGFQPSGAGATFLYCEDGEPTPVPYIVDEDVDAIIAQTEAGAGTGTVTSFSAGDLSPVFTTNVTDPTTTPALEFELEDQAANTFFAGPAADPDAPPTFRSIELADLPTPADAAANLVYAGPVSGADAPPSFRALIGDDLPITTVSDPGNFTVIDTDAALKVTIGGTDYYLPIYVYTP